MENTKTEEEKKEHSRDLCIVIVNYKTPELVNNCLATVVPQIESLNAKVVIVDNASGDDSVSKIEAWISTQPPIYHARINLVKSPINGGFSAGNNLGIIQENAEYYLLLNSDTLVRENAISTLLDRIRTDRNIGALGPQLEYEDGTPQISCFRRRSVASELIRGAQIDAISKLLKRKNIPIANRRESLEIDWISFACVMLPRAAIERVGLMDGQFFMYFEDIEYCLRLKGAGYKIEQEKRARVVHLRGGTSDVKKNSKAQKQLPDYFYRSRTRYFVLLGGKGKLLIANIAFTCGRLIRLTKRLVGKKPGPSIPGEWTGLWMDFFKKQKPVKQKLDYFSNK
ncbi:glycosyltransferase family 2 protein [Microbulbifer hydrolyticus]|uniref:Glycosyltransferase n=1 Tax=Microbulbifer hydrolyticus TaxID=48074 RepID=A0A6P1TCU5_9GAMM|nr:glycosyltransferase family 2 protein [Microbulbifer hydrolyticus]MBB5211835.1 hypothetical protein [Microbulbifer hydrolyticus]QHQ40578.1 glycosyltransferase [Microbulbifer hydrolyticus]